MFKEKIESLLNVRSGEWLNLIFFWSLNAVLWTGLTLGESVSEAVFLKRVGIEYLPWMFIVCSVFSIPFSILFTWLQNKIQPVSMAVILGLFASSAVFFSSFLLKSQMQVFSMNSGALFLYILQNILGMILSAHFSVILSIQFKTLDAKRMFPLILSGTVFGSLVGGLILHGYAENSGAEKLLFTWAILLIVSSILTLIFKNRLLSLSWAAEEIDTPKFQGKNWLDKILNEFKAATDSPLLATLAAAAFLMTVSRFFLEYTYSDIFSKSFTSENQLAEFFGKYVIFSNLFTLLFQTLITGRMIQYLGVNNANLFYPCTTMFSFIFAYLSYQLPAGVFARFNQEGFRRAVYQPVTNLFYNAVPPKRRSQSIAINESIIVPIAATFSGATLLLIPYDESTTSLIAFFLVIPWLICAWILRGLYSKSLLDMLKRSQISQLITEDKNPGVLDTQTQLLVVDALKNSQDDVVELASELLLAYGRPTARLALLRQASTGGGNIQKIILPKLVRFPAPDTRSYIIKCLSENDSEVRLAALKSLTQFPVDDEIREKMSEFLENPDIRFSATAAIGVIRSGDLVSMMKALLIFQRLLFSNSPDEIALGITSLGEIREERFWINLRSFLYSDNPAIRLAAVKSMNIMVKTGEIQEHLEVLQKLVIDPVREIRSYAIQIVGRVKSEKSSSILIEALGDLSPRNRKYALEALSAYGHEPLPKLLKVLDDPCSPVNKQEGAIRILALSQDPIVRERLAKYGKERIREIYELKAEERIIRMNLNQSDAEYFAMILDEKAFSIVRLILALVAPDRENQTARTVFKNLYSSNQEIMSNALEVLQSMGERTLIYHILPLLEGLSLDQVTSYGRRIFKIEDKDVSTIIKRHLLSLDKFLRDAAIYTIGKIRLLELQPVLLKLANSEEFQLETKEIRSWTHSKLAEKISEKVFEKKI
ncbi:MAG: HEAT repeat domain-containing protein [Candidatus Riflebacteria bacterium]|nr:HEAT repeat domain-containing protein [Candidatus Riflebacteria bacterium]